MEFEPSDSQRMVVDTAQRFVATEYGLEQWRERRAIANGVDARLWAKMAELGLLAVAIPEQAGGFGGTMEDVVLLMIEMGRGLVTEPVVSTGVLAVNILGNTLSGDARDRWLGLIASGEARIALAHAEPEEKADPLAARQVGDGFVLAGAKFMVFDAPSADNLLVTAVLGSDSTSSLFLVDAAAPGITSHAYSLIDGSRAADLSFADVGVPAAALISSGAKAVDVLNSALDRARLALVAQAVGAMESAMRVTAEYARERYQFGQPIGKFQAIQHLAADMFVAAYQARSALYAALCDIEGETAQRSRGVSIAKVVSGMAGQAVSRNGIQIHGGYGLTDEYAISHYFRRLLVLEKQYGSIDSHAGSLASIEALA